LDTTSQPPFYLFDGKKQGHPFTVAKKVSRRLFLGPRKSPAGRYHSLNQTRPPAPVRGAIFFSVSLLLLVTVGMSLQRSLGLAGIVLTQLLLFLGLALGFALSTEGKPLTEVFRLRRLSPTGVARSVGLGALSWALVQLLSSLIVLLVERAGGKLPDLYQDLASTSFVVALLVRALLPAICEEMAFRGYVQWNLGPLGDRAAVWITALLFGAMHFSLIRLVPLGLLGLLFATAVQRSGSIVSGMIMHLLNNTIVLVLTYFVKLPEGGLSALLSVPVLVAGILVLGAAAWALARSFGPGDTAREAAVAGEQVRAPRGAAALLLIPLLPALLLYAYFATYEVQLVFGGR
jgi:membrane protease YdiL (CAAX protease family)